MEGREGLTEGSTVRVRESQWEEKERSREGGREGERECGWKGELAKAETLRENGER